MRAPVCRSPLKSFKKRYFEVLPAELEKNQGDKRVMPGVRELLEALKDRPHVHLGLLTGNWQISGRMKIAYFGLDDFFPFGAFSDDSSDRKALVPIALRRFERLTGRTVPLRNVFVIGDTPADIECAKPHGVVSVAVAAAGHSLDDLRPHSPDLLWPDLTDLSAVLKVLG